MVERRPLSVQECLAGRDLTEPRLSPDGSVVAVCAADAGETHLVLIPVAGGPERRLSPWPIRGGRGLGGGSLEWLRDGSAVLCVAATGELWAIPVDGRDPHVLVRPDEGRTLSSPVVSPDGDAVAFVLDQAEVHVLTLGGTIARVDEGRHEFVSDPVWWNGQPLWIGWNPPHMPWDETELVGPSGVLGGAPGLQIQQPRTDVMGERLGWLDDSTGWLNVTVVGANGMVRAGESREHGLPSWGERQRSWCFDSTGERVAFVRNEDGFGRLCTMYIENGQIIEHAKAVHGQLSWVGDTLVAIRTGGKTPTQIVAYDTRTNDWSRRTLAVGPSHEWEGHPSLVEPELLTFASRDGASLPARLFRAPQSNGRTICWIHGGPTDQWQVTFFPKINYWIDRGYDVLVPDHRGSTGHGRAFTQSLRGRWGELDSDDIVDVLRGLDRDPATVAVLGGSAGGLTALNVVACEPRVAACAVVTYPVCDIAALDATTHRFEAHYNRTLVGTPDETIERSAVRSPIHRAHQFTDVPLLVMHGTADPVVSIEQSRALCRAIVEHGGSRCVLIEFDGEGHGFRNPDNKRREFDETEAFLSRHLR
ncbi:MAG: S9 family peptidase [Ilumatobacteraceae bacterium]